MNIYVSNLNYDTTSESLGELFTGYGETISAKVIVDKLTGFSRGFGFVEMTDETAGHKAIRELNDTEFEGKTINVNIARPRNDRNSRAQSNHRSGGLNRGRY